MGTETDKTEELISSLRKEEQKCLRTFTTQEASGRTVKVSKFEGLNLSEYKLAKAENCGQYHEVCRSGCSEMVHAARRMQFCLSSAFHYPNCGGGAFH